MAILGQLEDLGLAELVQAIAQDRRSGRLKLERPGGEALLVFREGKIIYAASSSGRETVGSLLLSRGLINESQLVEALDRQARTNEEKRLGVILEEMGAVTHELVAEMVREQAARVLSELIEWQTGVFEFENMEIPDRGEIEIDTHDSFLAEGLRADQILLTAAHRNDQLGRHRPRRVASENQDPRSPPPGPEGSPPPARPDPTLVSLRNVVNEIRSPEFTGEIAHRILSFAKQVFGRAALFSVRRDAFSLMASFGGGIETADPQIAGSPLVIPVETSGILGAARIQGTIVRERLGPERWRDELEMLGEPPRGESIAAPLTVDEDVMLVLYGDSLRDDAGNHWLDELEILMLRAGLTIEKDLLERRIEYYEQLRRETSQEAAASLTLG